MGSAVRFDSSTDRLARTTDLLNVNSPYTMMGWFYLVSDLNAFGSFMGVNDNAGLNLDHLFVNTDGTTLTPGIAVAGASTNPAGTNLSTGTWYHIAMVRSSTTLVTVYLNGVSDVTDTRNVSGRTQPNSRMEVGAVFTSNLFRIDARAAHLKAWTAALTQAEVQAEMQHILPIRIDGIYGTWPTDAGATERIKDYSGAGRNWAAGGTLTDEAGPTLDPAAPYVGNAWITAAGTSLAVTVKPSGVPQDDLVIVRLAYRNAGGTPTVTDTQGNTYTLDKDSANGSARAAVFSAPVTTALVSGNTITASFASSIASMTVEHYSDMDLGGTRVETTADASNTSTTPSVAATPAASGQLVIGTINRVGTINETTDDTDTTDGSWVPAQRTTPATTASTTVVLDGASKTVTGTTAQTWNPTLSTSRLWHASLVVYKTAGGTTHQGTAAATQGLTATAAALATRQGTATATQGLSATAVALVTRHATASATQDLTAVAAATRTAHGSAAAVQGLTAASDATATRVGSASATQDMTAASDATVTRQATAAAVQDLIGSVDATTGTVEEATASAVQDVTAATAATRTAHGSASATQSATAVANGTVTRQATASATQGLTAAADASVSAEGQGTASDTQGLTGAADATVTRQGAASGVQAVTAASDSAVTRQGAASAEQGLTGSANATVGATNDATAAATQGLSAVTVATLLRVGSAGAVQDVTAASDATIARAGSTAGVQELSAATVVSLTMQATASAVQDFLASAAAVPGLPIFGTAATVGYQTSATTVTSGDGAAVSVTSPARATTTVQGST